MGKFYTKKVVGLVLETEIKSLALINSSMVTHGLKRSLRNLRKEIALFKNHLEGSTNANKVIKKRKIDVQVGGGDHYLEGFLNIDIQPPADIIWDVREGIPLESNSAKLIFSEHFLEHIDYPVSVKKFIRECHRVLEKNGRLIIGVPNSALAVQVYYQRDKKIIRKFMCEWYGKRNCLDHFNTPIDFLNYHFRDQDDDRKYNPHFWAYDHEKLTSLLIGVNFRKIRKWKFDKKVANPRRKFGTIYVTAIK